MTRWLPFVVLCLAVPLEARAPEAPDVAKVVTPDSFARKAEAVASFSFDRDAEGRAPAGLPVPAAESDTYWRVQRFSQAVSRPYVLAVKTHSDGTGAEVAVPNVALDNGVAALQFMLVDADQGASPGLFWRRQEDGTGYLLQVKSGKDQLQLTRTVKGKSKVIDVKDIVLTPNRWHSLRVIFLGPSYTVYYDGDVWMAGSDKKIDKPGTTGLAASGDALVYFDDYSIKR